MNESYQYLPDESAVAFENLCVLIGQHWFQGNESTIDHDNVVIEYMAKVIMADHKLYEKVCEHLDNLEATWLYRVFGKRKSK